MTPKELEKYWRTRGNFKIDNKKISRIVDAIRQGSTKKLAAQGAGITYVCLHNWLKKGERILEQLYNDEEIENEKDLIYLDLWIQVSEAETELQRWAFSKIQEAAKDPQHWRAAEVILSRRFGKEYQITNNATTTSTEVEFGEKPEEPFKVTMTIAVPQDETNDDGPP